MEIFDYVVSAHGTAVFHVFEDYYIHKFLDYSSAKSICCFGFQGGHRFEIFIFPKYNAMCL